MAEQPPYEYAAWPAWYFGPDGQKQIFQSEEEVPEGWVDSPDKVGAAPEEIIEENNDQVASLIESNTAEGLVGMLEAMYERDATIEFVKTWPKLRLATTIVAHGGPLPKEA
jgi:hypothetical protein